jgi:hypothetical protein
MDDFFSDVKKLLEEDDPAITVEEFIPPNDDEPAEQIPTDQGEEVALDELESVLPAS